MSDSDQNEYIERRDGMRYVRGSQAPLESLVWLWRDGASAETIHEAYPTLRLAEVYGAIYSIICRRECRIFDLTATPLLGAPGEGHFAALYALLRANGCRLARRHI